MNLKQTRLHILHKPENLSKKAETGVSLHCHTENSKEMLDFVPYYAAKMPVVKFFWKRERKKYIEREGLRIDFTTAYWSPPFTASEVYKIEENQFNEAGLNSFISISDHDSIDGNLQINKTIANSKAPISMEWTVPFEHGFFHVGVHNLPEENAVEIVKDLTAYSFSKDEKPNKRRLHELFSMLGEIPQVLIVLNHPLWDIEMVGKPQHNILLKNFLKEYGKWLHALEINGFRTWSENKRVIEMAETLGFPVVTGGDRHGCKPNTVINLTNTKTFSEFVEEIRITKKSEVVLMPEYKDPLRWRQLQSFSEILSLYPAFPEHRRRWSDRVFYDKGEGGGLMSLSENGWVTGPFWLRMTIRTLGFMGSRKMLPMFKMTGKSKDRVPKNLTETKFEVSDLQDINASLPTSTTSASSAS